ncbi:soluble lamin-associated protein of 75 kDa-like isoform X2 [Salvelinus fontinalis]|uniref:soluble lamin-associated protein of 75 kDa-like isoform X2 n=1 Tax=Salvelinus fontinalis TaxID=8038 RepID=UPI0024860094|nr:soluble lamin-associated protein of 75 kDa-like isoform X2 [Salvelinus fontinalis]
MLARLPYCISIPKPLLGSVLRQTAKNLALIQANVARHGSDDTIGIVHLCTRKDAFASILGTQHVQLKSEVYIHSGMEFPVDVLDSVRQEEEEQAAEGYMTQLRYVSPDKTESFTLPSHRKISIGLCNVGFVPIYGGDLKHKVMALFSPDDQLTAVALYLAGQWWSVEDILRTSDPSRTGLVKARSLGERIVLYILNRIVYRVGEMDKPEVPFLCHGQHDFAKLLWKDGKAVGFYSVKPKDSLCNNFVTQRYQLPVMDSIFVRKCHRGNGHGLQMLEDFVDSFKDDQLGLKYPLSLTMYKAVLHAVTSNGDQRAASLDHTDVSMEEDNFLDITEDVLVVNTPLKLIEALDGTPVATRSRCSGHKKRGREETEDSTKESQPLKMNRLEDAKSEPTNTAVEDGGQAEEGREGEESGEAEAAVAPEEEKMIKAQIHTWEKRIVKMNGELTDGQREEEEGEAVLENRTTEEDVEIEAAAAKEEESIEAEDILEAAPVAPEGLAEAVEEEDDPLPLVEEPASVSEEAPSPAEPSPAEPSLSGDVREEATPMEEGEEDTVVATPVASEGLAEAVVEKEAASLPLVNEPASTPEEAPLPMEGEEVKREKEEEALERAVEEPEVKEKSEEVIAVDRSSKETLVQVRVADLSYQPLEEGETQPPEEEEAAAKEEALFANDENKGVEEMENATTTEEGSESSDEGGKGQALWSRVSGRGPAAPKRTSKRLNRVVIEQDREQPGVTVEEEEKATTTEEEEEEGAVEKSWAEEEVEVEEEQPPVIDQRALRRKSRPLQTPNKARGKRHGKI